MLPALSIYLVIAGLGIWRHQSAAAVAIQRWAWMKLGLCTLYLVTILSLSTFEDVAPGAFSFGIDVSEFSSGSLETATIVVYLCLVFWPTFVLVWFSRSMTKVSIHQWNRPGPG